MVLVGLSTGTAATGSGSGSADVSLGHFSPGECLQDLQDPGEASAASQSFTLYTWQIDFSCLNCGAEFSRTFDTKVGRFEDPPLQPHTDLVDQNVDWPEPCCNDQKRFAIMSPIVCVSTVDISPIVCVSTVEIPSSRPVCADDPFDVTLGDLARLASRPRRDP